MNLEVLFGFLSALTLLAIGLSMAAHRRLSEGLTDAKVADARLDEKINSIHKRLDKIESEQ